MELQHDDVIYCKCGVTAAVTYVTV